VSTVSDGWVDVRGGARGRGARLEDLERCAAVTSAVADVLWSVVADLRRARGAGDAGPVSLTGPWSLVAPGSATASEIDDVLVRQAREGLGEIAWGAGGLTASAGRLEDLHRKVTWMARAYLLADRGASATFESMTWTAGFLAGRVGAALTPTPFRVPGLPFGAPPGGAPIASAWVSSAMLGAAAITGRPAMVQVSAGLIPGVVSGTTVGRPANVAELAALGVRWSTVTPWLHESSRGVLASPRDAWGSSGEGGAGPSQFDGVAAIIDALAVAESGRRGILVARITAPDGRRSWLVAVPGVQTWDPVAGKDPYDLTSAVHAMAGGRPAVAAQVTDALEASGGRRGEPVLLAGHSMGGMVVAGLAADPGFRRRYRVTHVVTAGAPVAHVAMPRGTRVLSLEHAADVVPALDGRDNPDRARWITLRASGNGAQPQGSGSGRGFADHDIAAYRRTATRIDRTGPELLDGWIQGFEAFSEPGSEVRARRFRGTR